MAEVVESIPAKHSRLSAYRQYMDGRVWKLSIDEVKKEFGSGLMLRRSMYYLARVSKKRATIKQVGDAFYVKAADRVQST